MFWRRILVSKVKLFNLQISAKSFASRDLNIRTYSGTSAHSRSVVLFNRAFKKVNLKCYISCQTRVYSNGLLDGDVSGFQQEIQERELSKINELFPQPRVTLNEFTSKTLQRIFEIHYKQKVTTPKGSRKKQKPQTNDWTCTYTFVWPEKVKFESTALSKRQAAEKAATQALHYLYINNRIDKKGQPVYDKDKIQELKDTINESIRINVSEKSMERVDRIWEEYQSSIKEIYERTFKEAAQKDVLPPPVLKDSTLDEDDGYPETDSKSLDNEVEDILDQKIPVHPVFGKTILPPSESTLKRRDRLLQQKFEIYDEELTPLPIDKYSEEITSTLQSSRAAVIVGAAGCGKSTRAPAAILRSCRSAANVIVSEPRRVAARGLAGRVAGELGEEVGETVGYQVRLEAKPPRPPAGGLLYCTSGVLLRRLQSNPGLEGCTHVFIDEAHERDVNTDITLLLLKRALHLNKNLRVIIMSATLDTQVFTRYFDSCPVIEVPGRSFPVEVSYLEDIQKQLNINLPNTTENCSKEKPYVNCQELVDVITAVDKTQTEGAVLVFLPGWAEIKLTKQILDERCPHNTHVVLPVHSRLSTEDQVKIFTKPLPGVRKIVLATNIAETSITIPDVVHVIDAGAHKENRIKEGTGTASLETVWVSQAGAKQRAGRAGRVQPGHCYKLYTKEKEQELAAHTTPEILRIPLEQTVLDCKSYAPEDKVEDFLSQLPEPPTDKAIQFAVNDLIDLGALTHTQHLTRLGHILSRLPLAPRLACALLHASLAGNVLSAANVLTHCQDNLQVFSGAIDRRADQKIATSLLLSTEIRELKSRYSNTSDHAAMHWIQDEFERNVDELGWKGVDQWCDTRGLRKDRLSYVKSLSSLYIEQLLKCGVIEPSTTPEELNRFSDLDEITAAILLSGSNALLRTRRHVKTKGKLKTATGLFTSTGDRAHIASSSVTYNKPASLLAFSGGLHCSRRRALVVHMASAVPPHTALLFAKGGLRKSNGNDDSAILTLTKHKLQVHMTSSQADNILKAKEMLWNTFQYYIERDLKTLDYEENTTVSRFKIRLMKSIGRILVEGHREYVLGKTVEEFVDG